MYVNCIWVVNEICKVLFKNCLFNQHSTALNDILLLCCAYDLSLKFLLMLFGSTYAVALMTLLCTRSFINAASVNLIIP